MGKDESDDENVPVENWWLKAKPDEAEVLDWGCMRR